MGRGKTRITLTDGEVAQLRQEQNQADDPRARERLRLLLRAAEGRHTLDDLARHAGRSRSTIQVWLEKFRRTGLSGLLQRRTPPGAASPIASRKVQRQMRAAIKSGRLPTAAALAAWLKERHGIERSRKSIYYWRKKLTRKPPPSVPPPPL